MILLVHLCLSLLPGPEWPAGQLVDIWQVSCRHCPEDRKAPAVHLGGAEACNETAPQQVTVEHELLST